ncbi:zinc finger protein 593 homolog [Lucilia sericata]|uniref:zinc finger protein 593 homolog n=1 Tax=Lucilia sericata TaxID=13632 RepID=UPI0018A853C8|nr:zinc finger protein 593 homolog [Lucilia sericata]XP_037827526.1 zinc finger protein 593 homolog [Lucilia sericata]XP_037827648.1 zinc finger protein 593 homolog [Lucilia sericata]
MGMVQKRKKMHSGDTHLQRRWRVRNRTRDLDLIDEDIRTQSAQLINQAVDLEKPGFAQFYCVHCAKYFIDDTAMQAHFRTKVHKRRLKALETEPYTIEESERAAGRGNYEKPKKRTMETQPSKEEVKAGKRIKVEVVAEGTPAKKQKMQKMET